MDPPGPEVVAWTVHLLITLGKSFIWIDQMYILILLVVDKRSISWLTYLYDCIIATGLFYYFAKQIFSFILVLHKMSFRLWLMSS